MHRSIRKVPAALALAAAVWGGTAPAVTGTSARTGSAVRCGTVTFARQSDDGAFQIAAESATCATARAVAEASRSSRYRVADSTYSADGFSCAGRSQRLGGAGKQVVRFQCTRQHSAVSFLRG